MSQGGNIVANGETAAYVRDQMGHSSIKVTFDTYGVRKTFAIEGEEKGGSDATN